MNIDLTWNNPTPHPSCGFKASYRRKGDPFYSFLTTSGATSGTTSLHITANLPASYEGFVQSNCCTDALSDPDPWGVNAYGLVSVVNPFVQSLQYKATFTSPYPNPYDTIIAGTFNTTDAPGNQPFSVTYPAGATNVILVLTGSAATPGAILSNAIINSISPIFNNGGQLQQFDTIKTPAYFEFATTSGQTSGTTLWNGAPIILPSFTLDTFTVTGTDGSGNALAGDLTVSWIQGSIFAAGVYPYNQLTFTTRTSPAGVLLGTGTAVTTIKGLRTLTISMVSTVPITTANPYKMDLRWADGSLLTTKLFNLPDF